MEFDDFKILEDKIARVLERVGVLKQENADLKHRLDTLQAEYNDKATELERVSLELKECHDSANTHDSEKEEKIRQKVSSLLDKLEKF